MMIFMQNFNVGYLVMYLNNTEYFNNLINETELQDNKNDKILNK